MPIEPLQHLRQKLHGKTQVALAEELGISTSYLADILSGRRAIGPKVLRAMGLEEITVYVKVAPEASQEALGAAK